jgi:hypothetical protein
MWEIICYNDTKFVSSGTLLEIINRFLKETKLSEMDIKTIKNLR